MEKVISYDQLPELFSVDVAVAGGGLAGCGAAIAAAQNGAKTLVIESSGCLGGAATLSLVAPISSVRSKDGRKFGGILWEMLERVMDYAKKYCGATKMHAAALHAYKYVLLEMFKENNVEVLFHSFITDVVSDEQGKIKYLVVATKSGLKKITAKQFVDATGDADVAYKSNADTIYGSEPLVFSDVINTKGMENDYNIKKDDYSGKVQPVSLMMLMGNVDVETGIKYMNKKLTYSDLGITKEEFRQWKYANTLGFEIDEESELVPMPQGRVWLCQSARENEAVINMSRVINVNPCDPLQYAKAEVDAGLQLTAIIDFLISFVPGFEKAYLIESSSSLGIRESRRLVGDYMLTGSDTIGCKLFEDTIAHGSYIIDIHDPCGKRMAIGGSIEKNHYSIPFRCLITSKVPNLSVAGRCISSDHVSMSSTRIQGTAMLTGQAAGTAAAIAVNKGIDTAQVNFRDVQNILKESGVLLETL